MNMKCENALRIWQQGFPITALQLKSSLWYFFAMVDPVASRLG